MTTSRQDHPSGRRLLSPLTPSPSPSAASSAARNSRAARFAFLVQGLFTVICLLIFIDFFISRNTFSTESRIEQAICRPNPRNLSQNAARLSPYFNDSSTSAAPSNVTAITPGESNSTKTITTNANATTLITPPTAAAPIEEKQVATFVITCGTAETDAVSEMSALLKSVLAFASEPIRLIFITDANGAKRLWKIFARDLVQTKRKLWVDIHLLKDSIVNDWAAKIRLDPVGHHSGRWGTAKLMLPWILKDVKRVVVLDTDMVFVEDPIRLWELFDDNDQGWIYKMPVWNKTSQNHMCSCIVLIKMDLAREKKVFPTLFYQSLISGPKSWWIKDSKVWRPLTGDQGLYWLMMRKYPSLFRLLPSNWDKDYCHGFYGALSPNSRQRVSLLHRNCAGQNSAIVKDQASPFFDFFLHYRWHWLTPQSGKSFAVQIRNFTVSAI